MANFGFGDVQVASQTFADPAADTTWPFFRVSDRHVQVEILRAWVSSDTALSAGTSNGRELNLVNMGTAGTATTVISTVAGSATGGTYAAWTANTPVTLTVSAGTLLKNQYLGLQYNETGTDAPKNMTVHVEYVVGKAS